jgi:hypothetical protein
MKTHRISFFILILALSALTCNLPAPSIRPQTTPLIVSSNGVQVSIVPVSTATLIAAKDFAALNSLLALKIAALNVAQLKFIRDMQALSHSGRLAALVASPQLQTGSALTDQDLKDIAGKAMDAAILSDQLGELSARQDKGSPQAAQSTDSYAAIARTAFALVIEAQNIRAALQNNLMPGSAAIEAIAAYGAQLWNASVMDGNIQGNPFMALAKNAEPSLALNPGAAAQVQSQINADNSSIWIAQSATQISKTLDVPAAQAPVPNPFDPQLMGSLTTAEGQNEGDKARQVAAANLQRLGATTNSSDPSQPMQLQLPINPIAVSGSEQIKAGNLQSFLQGAATVVSKEKPNDENAFMQGWELIGVGTPSDQGKTTVQDEPALVNLNITNIVIKNVDKLNPAPGSFGAEAMVDFSFTVNWSTTLAAPQFDLYCNDLPPQSITQASGALTFSRSVKLWRYPNILHLSCHALPATFTIQSLKIYRGRLGKIDAEFLVGDAAEATQRVIKLETAIANADATQTAIAQTALNAPLTQAAFAATSNIVATEVYAAQTAEFKLTAAAFETAHAPTAIPTLIPSFTLNGTFSINWSRGYYTTGFINLTVDALSGQVSGSINGSGAYSGDETCQDGAIKNYTTRRVFSGSLVGAMDTKTGALKLTHAPGTMSGTVSTSGGCSDPMTMGLAPGLALDGTIDLKNHTAQGRIFSTLDYDPGEGDWHAGE